MLMIKDREGFISANLARHYFERAVRDNVFLATPLDCTVGADGLVEYADPKTHAMWVGWALGMRCQQRIEMEQSAQDAGIGPVGAPQAA